MKEDVDRRLMGGDSTNNQETTAGVLAGGQKAWRIRPPISQAARHALAPFPPLQAQLLVNRGITSPSLARAFLSGQPLSHDPFALPGMEAAVQRVRGALQRKEPVAVFGDFDVDGVSAAALLATALRPLGCQVIPYIPHRIDEGHGLSLQAVQQLAAQGVRLLITVDCGVSSAEEIAAAARAGMDTIVTDHHLPPARLPPALAIVDPRLPDSRYPFPDLTGAGLALKLAQALYDVTPVPTVAHSRPVGTLFTLAALGTIADVAPLLDENRSIVRQGLDYLTSAPSPGLSALMRSAQLEGRTIDTEAVGWVLAPRLNASGRIDDAVISYRLLTTQSPQEAQSLAQVLEQQNRQRQEMTEEAYQKAKALLAIGEGGLREGSSFGASLNEDRASLKEDKEVEALLMVGDASFSPGVIGLVAGRLAEEFARPAVVVSLAEKTSRGSCRSVPWFNIGRALYQVADEIGGFARHGGHAQAAGFTVETPRLPRLRQALLRLARASLGQAFGTDSPAAEPPPPCLDVDLELPLGALPKEVYYQVQALAPFGPGNPEPVFLSRGVQVAGVRPLGANGKHLRLNLRDRGVAWSAVAFSQAERLPRGAAQLDIVYVVEVDRWAGQESLQLRVLDFRVTG
ncbi:MAG: single-stranded-DNA-specific exonuclease RecJ [Chloroflexi bacterium]|nr:single-stranded-DNA-specific exonuclease RecJ [Chloroflexota bacterium]